jgi:hypothetical protein
MNYFYLKKNYFIKIFFYNSKSILQKLANSYNNCIFKLINDKSVHDSIINSSEDFNKWNTLLEQYGLNGFQHRLIIRLATYMQKIFCFSNSPSNLANCFTLNNDLNKSYNLRNLLELKLPDKGKYNNYREDTFEYFFSKFINVVINEIIRFRFGKYKKYIKENSNILHLKTIRNYNRFDLNFKIYYNVIL